MFVSQYKSYVYIPYVHTYIHTNIHTYIHTYRKVYVWQTESETSESSSPKQPKGAGTKTPWLPHTHKTSQDHQVNPLYPLLLYPCPTVITLTAEGETCWFIHGLIEKKTQVLKCYFTAYQITYYTGGSSLTPQLIPSAVRPRVERVREFVNRILWSKL